MVDKSAGLSCVLNAWHLEANKQHSPDASAKANCTGCSAMERGRDRQPPPYSPRTHANRRREEDNSVASKLGSKSTRWH